MSNDGHLLVLLGQGKESTTTLEIIQNWRADVERRLRGVNEAR